MEKIRSCKVSGSFSHSPYSVNLSQYKGCAGDTRNDRECTSPPHARESVLRDDGEHGHSLSTSPITVQAKHRPRSPGGSYHSPGALCSISSVDKVLRSPVFTQSGNASFHGENFHYTSPSACIQVQPKEVSGGANCSGARGMGPYPTGTGGCSYTPMGFSAPLVLPGSMNSSRTASQARSPITDTVPLVGSPPAALISRGAEYLSPSQASTGTSPYHTMDCVSFRSTSHTLTSPLSKNNKNRSHAVPRGTGVNADTNRQQQRSRPSHYRTSPAVDELSNMSESSESSIRDDLERCPNDVLCSLINDRKHQRKYIHTCRLFPCYHGHVLRHAKLFRHLPGQVAESEGLKNSNGGRAKLSAHALASVTYTSISPEAPNAYKIIVSHREKSYEIFGDWENVRVHTFKRYLHQVYKIPPASQVLVLSDGDVLMDDDIEPVGNYGVKPESVIVLKRKEDSESPHVPLEDL